MVVALFCPMSSLAVALAGTLFAAETQFPRGDGLYFHPAKLFFLFVLYIIWLRTCWWVNRDCQTMSLPAEMWNPILLSAGLAGLLFVWLMPWFWLGFLVLFVLYLAPTLSYVTLRNEKTTYEQRVLTPYHLRQVARRWLRLDLAEPEAKGERPIPIRFIRKSDSGKDVGDDNRRLARVQGSKGYRAALEMMAEALERRTTDIHLEPTKEEMSVRFRIDGILEPATPFTRAMGDAVINIFKVLANLDITEKRKPQDGGFSAEVQGSLGLSQTENRAEKDEDEDDGGQMEDPRNGASTRKRQIDFRVATAGSVVGEKMVMRILDPARQVVSLTKVGMREPLQKKIRSVVAQPHGLFIVCGPTGAGKSTTLYACLAEIDRYQKNVITVENPVEYHIDNVTQIEINPKAGKTFASELRSILRQDPDVIYIGEIRDHETAEIACQAAQTGHMVFTTLHANDTVTALARLIDLGVQPYMVANAISAILGQRLVRILCPACKQRYKPNVDLLRKANLPADKIKFFYRPPDRDEEDSGSAVCEVCGGTGYHGRTGVFEFLEITDSVRDMIRENPNFNAIKHEAVRNGMKYLQEDGLRQVIDGQTSIQELLRVCSK